MFLNNIFLLDLTSHVDNAQSKKEQKKSNMPVLSGNSKKAQMFLIRSLGETHKRKTFLSDMKCREFSVMSTKRTIILKSDRNISLWINHFRFILKTNFLKDFQKINRIFKSERSNYFPRL